MRLAEPLLTSKNDQVILPQREYEGRLNKLPYLWDEGFCRKKANYVCDPQPRLRHVVAPETVYRR